MQIATTEFMAFVLKKSKAKKQNKKGEIGEDKIQKKQRKSYKIVFFNKKKYSVCIGLQKKKKRD